MWVFVQETDKSCMKSWGLHSFRKLEQKMLEHGFFSEAEYGWLLHLFMLPLRHRTGCWAPLPRIRMPSWTWLA